ncbi:MAG: cytochrome c3 family protein [Desulfobacterales bacterium]|nr:MAG: cytochrome c3 family protein [Desulfobacterales bacterium]
MKKWPLILLLFVIVSVLFFVSAYSQEDMRLVNTDAFDSPQRPPAVFNHDKHNETAQIEECYECHHVYDEEGKRVEDESSEDQLCSDCHELETSGRKLALMKAFHTNCKGCHKEKGNGPVMCGQCHVRRPVIEE